MARMDKRLKATGFEFPWGKAFGFGLLALAVIYAANHPHTFFAILIKGLLLPIP